MTAVGVAACDTPLSGGPSCEEFNQVGAMSQGGVEMVQEAYLDKFSGGSGFDGMTVMRNMSRVASGCHANPKSKVDEFLIEVD